VIALTRAELLKLRTTRTTLGLAVGMVALVLLVTVLFGLLTDVSQLSRETSQRALLAVGGITWTFTALAGLMLVTSEYRFGTIRPTFLFEPRRARVVTAKFAASMIAGLLLGAVGQVLGLIVGYVILRARGIPIMLGTEAITTLVLGTVAGAAVWGAVGLGLGALVRNQVGAIVGLLTWSFIVESLLMGFVPSVGRFAPGPAGNALVESATANLLSPAAGGAVLIAWALALTAIGAIMTNRRDVS
jgi:ABC-2 type transport system permease protein